MVVFTDRSGGHFARVGRRTRRHDRTLRRRTGLRLRGRLFHRRRGNNGRLLPGPSGPGDGTAARHDGGRRARLQNDRGPDAGRHRRRLPQFSGELHDIWAHGQRERIRRSTPVGRRVRENGERVGHFVPQPLHTTGGPGSAQVPEKSTSERYFYVLNNFQKSHRGRLPR